MHETCFNSVEAYLEEFSDSLDSWSYISSRFVYK